VRQTTMAQIEAYEELARGNLGGKTATRRDHVSGEA